MRNFDLFWCIVLWLGGTVHAENPVLLRAFVPLIQQSGYYLLPNENGYQLILEHPDGDYRQETVTFETNKETGRQALHVVGDLILNFPDTEGTAEITYDAGPNGNHVKYYYSWDTATERPTPVGYKKGYLKSAAGG